ncbi:hypothetical protein ACFPVV_04040 [Macrococcoides bohemicum]|uniref:Lipoprotein n=1 Tax=Macrococcoides bohemicum TaxID=1903056 RepID=A0A328A635_9STAP|nr:hypothetical protein [Macrococcus bohemicus]RAK49314.1 hypothetical protein BHX94_05740 [Macrococcus bohemicus]
MNVKKMSILLSAAIILVACGKEDTAPKEKVKTEQKESAADIARKKIKASREKHKSNKNDSNTSEIETTEPAATTEELNTTEAVTTEELNTTEAVTTEELNTTEPAMTEAVVKENVNNITNINTLSQIIYSNDYTYDEKMAAYQSGVANGLIPQGTNTSSPAAAFESALQVERTEAQSTTEAPAASPTVDPNTGLPVQP